MHTSLWIINRPYDLYDCPTVREVTLYNMGESTYRQVSDIRRTKSQHLKDSRAVLRLSLPNPLKPDVKSRMKM